MPSAGDLIWTSLTPTFKMMITCGLGFWLTKKGLFPPPASRGFSQVCLNVALPCLIFSSIVPSFNSDNISALGPLIMTAIFYQVTGLCLAFLIRTVCWVPRDFRWGILIAGALSNWGNMPTAIVQSVSTKAPFDATTDTALGVGFVSIFIMVYNLTFFSGLYKVCAWDFVEPEGGWEEEDYNRGLKERMRRKAAKALACWAKVRGHGRKADEEEKRGEKVLSGTDLPAAIVDGLERGERPGISDAFEITKNDIPTSAISNEKEDFSSKPDAKKVTSKPLTLTTSLTRHPSAAEVESVLGETSFSSDAPANARLNRVLDTIPASRPHSPSRSRPHSVHSRHSSQTHHSHEPHKGVLASIWSIVNSFFTPITTTLIISLICALVSPLKALFVDNVEGWSGTRVPYAPDGTPILAFLTATATFLGNITVPGGLILLGASFARLRRPDNWSKLPLPAITLLLLSKMVVLPVIGITFIQNLSAHTSLYPEDAKMLRFVAMLLSGTPAAVNQLVITQLAAPDGADTLAAFLLPQYILLFVLSTALCAVALLFVS